MSTTVFHTAQLVYDFYSKKFGIYAKIRRLYPKIFVIMIAINSKLAGPKIKTKRLSI